MGNNLTSAVRGLLAAACCLAAPACTGGSDPDPRVVARSVEPPRAPKYPDDGPRLVVAECVHTADVPAAPIAEVLPPDAPPAPRRATMLVGHSAAPAIDAAVVKTFVASCTDFTGDTVGGSDRDAVEWLSTGRGAFAVIGGQLSQRDLQAGLQPTRLGVELFAVCVPPASPLRSLTHPQVRQILTGQVRTWAQLGVHGGDITVVVPSEPALAERAARALIPGDDFAASCHRAASDRHVADQLLQHPDAIGVVRVTETPSEAGQRLLQIDWCPPTLEAFGYGTYPYGIPVTLVTSGAPRGIAQGFVAFARSAEGRALLGRTLALQQP